MEFYSLAFWGMIAVALALYYTVLRSRQWVCLLIFSVLYYAICGISGAGYLLVTAVSTWWIAGRITGVSAHYKQLRKAPGLSKEDKSGLKKKATGIKRIYLLLDLVLNIGILCGVKYLALTPAVFGNLLSAFGISFYTFASIAYLVDIYNDKYKAEKNFGKMLLFLSYFPQVIQGPINRFDKMEPQFMAEHKWDTQRFKKALWLFVFGAMKKYAIADMLSGSISGIFDNGSQGLPGSLIVFGILLYSAQQYADFSGGIDMVFAVSEMFGITMMQNFKRPYFAVSLGDFWRRWHISLGAFMRDYVFYPFALIKSMQNFGKWCSKHLGKHFGRVLPAGIANILVFFLVGIWHGIEMHYVLWGLYNGLVIAISDICSPLFARLSKRLGIREESRGLHIFRILRTFLIVNIGWYFDRIYDLGDCIHCLRNTVLYFAPYAFIDMFRTKVLNTTQAQYLFGGYCIAFCSILFVFADSILQERGTERNAFYQSKPYAVRVSLVMIMIFLTLASFMFVNNAGGFMYANF